MAYLKPFLQRFLTDDFATGTYFSALQTFLNKKQKRVSVHTLGRLYYNLHPLGREFANPQLSDLDRHILHAYQKKLWMTYAAETVRTKTADLRGFFRWAKRQKLISDNPAKRLKPVDATRSPRRRARAVSEQHVDKVISNLSGRIQHLVQRDIFGNLEISENWTMGELRLLRDLFVLVFLYETGARAGELVSLGTAVMTEATRERKNVYTIVVVGKTENRIRHFTQSTADLWFVWSRIRPAGAKAYAISGWRQDKTCNNMTVNGLSRAIVRRCNECNVPPFRANSLRHAKIKRARQQFGLELTGKLMDHSNLRSTLNYANIDDTELSNAAKQTGLKINLF